MEFKTISKIVVCATNGYHYRIGMYIKKDGKKIFTLMRREERLPDIPPSYDVFEVDGKWIHNFHTNCKKEFESIDEIKKVIEKDGP